MEIAPVSSATQAAAALSVLSAKAPPARKPRPQTPSSS
jgi:hypothetical protein